jgi:UV DNA damage endonuclease
MMIRLGLCCMFRDEPIKFGNTTAAAISRLSRDKALAKLSGLCLANAAALLKSLECCAAHGIGAFRVISQILPLKTHPLHKYEIAELPAANEILATFQACKAFAEKHNLRTSFHPDQFVVLNSQRPEVVAASIAEIEYQAEVAEWIGADVINIHAGGAFGDKAKSLEAFARTTDLLSPRARSRLTVENDDKIFTPADLLDLCRRTGIPLVYDVHHHRCHGDGLSIESATEAALKTWNREPLFHISSPLEGWNGPKPQRHHDFVALNDFPTLWLKHKMTVDVEAKAKELAVLKLKQDLAGVFQNGRKKT